jgi:hypothetical protein
LRRSIRGWKEIGLVAILLLGSSCAAIGTAIRDQRKYREAGDHIYNRPIEFIWPEVSRLLREAGYSAREGPGEYSAVTDWTVVDSSLVSGHSTRYLVQGTRIGPTHCIVRFIRHDSIADSVPEHTALGSGAFTVRAARGYGAIRSRSGGFQASRDLVMEWKLLQIVQPEVAAMLELEE